MLLAFEALASLDALNLEFPKWRELGELGCPLREPWVRLTSVQSFGAPHLLNSVSIFIFNFILLEHNSVEKEPNTGLDKETNSALRPLPTSV